MGMATKKLGLPGLQGTVVDNVFQKTLKTGMVGATSLEIAHTVGITVNALQGNADFKEEFDKNYYNKIWNWMEIQDSDIQQVSEEQNLINYNQENFSKVVWVCKRKQ